MTIKGNIGLEIESYTKEIDILKDYCYKRKWSFEDDGSIRAPRRQNYTPIEFKAGIYKIEDIKTLIEDLKIPFSIIKTNSSCGLHINISFDNITDYYKLLSWNFVDNFQQTIKKEFKTKKEIKRLIDPNNKENNNYYCRCYINENEFDSMTNIQLKSDRKNARYYSVNYNSFNLHRTIEFRIFASTTSIKKLQSYLKLLFDSIEQHLSKTKIEDKKLDITITRVIKKESKPIVNVSIITKNELIETMQQKNNIGVV